MEFDEKVQEMQQAFAEERIKRFAIVSPELLKQSDYVKSLYIRMLCALMRCGNPTEEQILFVRRIMVGAELKDDIAEFMRQSMYTDVEKIDEFAEALSSEELKYYFVIDGCIVLNLDKNAEGTRFLANCAELLEIELSDMKYLAYAAKAIVLQDGSIFDEAKQYLTNNTQNVFLYYKLQ